MVIDHALGVARGAGGVVERDRVPLVGGRRPGERRVAATPETVKKFIALGAGVAVEAGATR